MQLITVILIILWAISVFLGYDFGKKSALLKTKRKVHKKIITETEQTKRLKLAEQRFWHYDGSDADKQDFKL